MDAIKLKKYAVLLEAEIRANLDKSKDVDWLAQYQPLLEAIEDARAGRIDRPPDLGLARWETESEIQAFRSISHRLAQFELLLEDWPLAED